MLYGIQNCPTEWAYRSGKAYDDPFNEVTLDVVVTDPTGQQHVVPTFWAGDQTWRVRYASPLVGQHRYVTECSDPENRDLHGQEGVLEVTPYIGSNQLYKHGPLRVAADRRYLEHLDGTPFFWLGDTWWMSLCRRLSWPDEFRVMVADRVAKGFSVIQIVAGLYPDMPPFDERGANEAGFPWQPDYGRINPAYFDAVDLRLAALLDAGLLPCLVGCWGYFVQWMGVERMKQHWRYLIARYGAYPMVWCLAGEAMMPYYLSEDPEGDATTQRRAWTELAAYVRRVDPYHHPLTLHPTAPASTRDQVEGTALLDIDMLQTGHRDRESLAPTVEYVARAVATAPRLPVINGEVCYEGILEASRQEIQRLMFWVCVLSGAAGHTYGANGIWQLNTRAQPFGPSPHGASWGNAPWEDAYRLPGSTQVGLGKRLLERYPWWRFAPHQDWVSPLDEAAGYARRPYAAGIPHDVRVVYFPCEAFWAWWRGGTGYTVTNLEADRAYRAFFFDPITGRELPLGTARGDETGAWRVLSPMVAQDWVLVLDQPTPATQGPRD